VAGQYALLGFEPEAVIASQLAIGVGTTWFLFLLGRTLGGLLAATLAGLLGASFPTFLFYEGIILKTYLGVHLVSALLWSLLFCVRRSSPWSLLSGVLLGLGCLVRANLLLVAPLALFWLLRQGSRPHAGGGLRRCAFLLLGLAVPLLPVTWHNVRCGDFALTTAQAGQNFYIGNNPANTAGTYQPPAGVRPHPFYEQQDFQRLAEQDLGRTLKPSETSRYWLSKGLQYLRDNPAAGLQLGLRKLGLVFNREEIPDNVSFPEAQRQIAALRWPLPSFWIVLALACASLVLCRPWPAGMGLLVVTFLILTSSVAVFFVFSRYRLSAVPILLVLTALLPSALGSRLRQRDTLRLAMALLAAGGSVVISGLPLYQHSAGSVAYNQAVTAMKEGDVERAFQLSEKALAEEPGYYRARILRGSILRQRQQFAAAERDLRNALRQDPADRRGRLELGLCLQATGQAAAALEQFAALLADFPGDAGAVVAAAESEAQLGRQAAARQRLSHFVARFPQASEVWNALGVQHAYARQFAEAEAAFRSASEADPANGEARMNLGQCLEARGDRSAARQIYQELLRQQPDHRGARSRLQQLGG
jgi:tetratricopeptide (TPR) repeat protein